MLNATSQRMTQRRDLNWKRAARRQTRREQNGTTVIGPVILMRCAVIGTSGMIATGGTIIATRSFSLALDIIFWTGTIGTRRGVTIHCRATMTTTGPFIPTVIYSLTK